MALRQIARYSEPQQDNNAIRKTSPGVEFGIAKGTDTDIVFSMQSSVGITRNIRLLELDTQKLPNIDSQSLETYLNGFSGADAVIVVDPVYADGKAHFAFLNYAGLANAEQLIRMGEKSWNVGTIEWRPLHGIDEETEKDLAKLTVAGVNSSSGEKVVLVLNPTGNSYYGQHMHWDSLDYAGALNGQEFQSAEA